MPDYPDGIEQFNLSSQSLSEVINRPKYGAAQRATGFYNNVPGNSTVQILEVTGKGVIYGGFIGNYTPTNSHKEDYPELWVDGIRIDSWSWENKNSWNINDQWRGSVYIIRYDDVNFLYAGTISPGITFESSFSIRYHNGYAADVSASAEAFYALI